MALSIAAVIAVCHTVTGFGKREKALNSGRSTSDGTVSNYVKYNVPLHVLYAGWYAVAAVAMIEYI